MTNIRYVCISDMHLGEEDSILTAINNKGVDTTIPGPVLVELVRCLKELISKNKGSEKPTLILNGDILELALSTTEVSAMVFERFLELFMKKDEELFDKIIYVPGNHDHHLWEQAREIQYLEYIKRHPESELPAPWHKTEMFLEGLNNPPHCHFLERVINRYFSESSEDDLTFASDIKILVAYPNFGLRSKDCDKCIVIHHGHFVESEYRLISTLKAFMRRNDEKIPKNIQQLESENFAWIDFLWSALGRSGDAGDELEILYEHMRNSEHMKKYISEIAEKLAKKCNIPGLGVPMAERMMQSILERSFDQFSKRERGIRSEKLGKDTEEGIKLYLNTTWNQINKECDGLTPSELIFIFGHTHKPCEEQIYIEGIDRNVQIYNTGGWVVDTVKPNPVFGGSVVLIDDELDLASIHMYKENSDPDKYCVEVKAVDEDEKENSFYDRISEMINCNEQAWQDFSSKAYSAVVDREKRLDWRLRKYASKNLQ